MTASDEAAPRVAIVTGAAGGLGRVIADRLRADGLTVIAGIAGPTAPVHELPADAWARVLAVNLSGTFHCTRAALPPMLDASWGRIVNVASIAGKDGNPNMSAYSASKAGVIALTKSVGDFSGGRAVY